ncbi:MAG: molybdopterin-binding protein [Proteobacteria bacterium]|nr:molybdopterin-binding protein [Pseudomonadota bacterium]
MQDCKQTIKELTPLADVVTMLGELANPVATRDIAAGDAAGKVLAMDIKAASHPVRAMALTDGWAVAAADVADASSYAPIILGQNSACLETGDDMPPDTDAVLPPDAVVVRGSSVEAIASVASGNGVLAAGGDVEAAKSLYVAGQRLRALDVTVLTALDIANISTRVPRISIVAAREDLRLAPAVQFIARDCAAQGATARLWSSTNLEDVLDASDADAVVMVGGTGSGGRDGSIVALAQAGSVLCHGIGINPGQSAALGTARGRMVLIVPGRLDAAMAAWLLIGRRLLDRLSGCTDTAAGSHCRLTRKVTSTIGVCDFILVRETEGEAAPLGGRYLPLSAFAGSTGYVVVPPDSEGYAAGSGVAIHRWS